MDEDGVESWRFGLSVTAVPLALYVRDALRLDTSTDALSPPPLLRQPPDRSGLLTPHQRLRGAREWSAWWRAVVHYDGRFHAAEPGRDFLAWYRPYAAERADAVGEPPDFRALGRSPALQRAVIELAPEADAWAGRHDTTEAPTLSSEAIAASAEDVAVRYRVPSSSVRGLVLAHATQGQWSRVAEPGVMICSISCVQTDDAAAPLVREVLESGLR